MSGEQNKERKWAANIAFVGDESKVKELINYFKKEEAAGGISDFTRIDGPHEKLQDLLKDRVENLLLPKPELKATTPALTDPSDSVSFKSDYEQDMPVDDYDEDIDE